MYNLAIYTYIVGSNVNLIFEEYIFEYIIFSLKERYDSMETNFTLPNTGGFISTDFLIILGVAVVFVILYVIFCLLRENKNNDLKEFSDNDFVDNEQEKQ